MSSRHRILNVDDNEVARYVKRRILADAGFEVVDASCAAEALAALDTAPFDLALVDMKLPDMTGFELTRRIRSHALGCKAAIIQISAICVTSDDRRDGLDSGADAYLVVPFESDELVRLAREVTAHAPVPSTVAGTDDLARSRVRLVDAFIRANLHRALRLEDLATAAGLSPFYFTRMFKAATGSTPLDYLMEARVAEATRLLGDTALPLGEIAERTGFRTHAHFSTVFRKRRGCAPRSLRSAMKEAAPA